MSTGLCSVAERDRWRDAFYLQQRQITEARVALGMVNFGPNREAEKILARLDAAESEVARLRAGEADEPGPEHCMPTPAQWLREFNDATPERRLQRVEALLGNAEGASRCFLEDHVGRLADHAADAALVRAIRSAIRVNGGVDVRKAFGG